MSTEGKKKEVWIGLIGVVALRDGLLPVNCQGAYVNGLALVTGIEEYEKVAREQLEENGFQVLSIEDVEKFGERIKAFQVEKALLEMARVCESTGDFCLGTFFVWEDEQESEKE